MSTITFGTVSGGKGTVVESKIKYNDRTKQTKIGFSTKKKQEKKKF